jgi:virginiamycin B lyase
LDRIPREVPMSAKRFLLAITAGLGVVLCQIGLSAAAQAQAPVALTGQVSSAEEGLMEGVLVSARKTGATFTITVVSDQQGRYQFPASKLEPGQYGLRIRAAGYDLDGHATAAVVAQKTTTMDLKLRKTSDLASQLTNAEWLASMTGTQQQKNTLLGCVGCHTLERIVRSRYDAEGFLQTVKRMSTYANQSTPLNPQRRLTTRDTDVVGEDRARIQRAQAEFLSTINLSSSSSWDYPLKTFPRPRGRATQVVITEYDLPRPTIEPHDVIVDSDGIAWYSNFGEQTLGKLDPKTGKVTEIPVPEIKKGSPLGSLSLRFDKEENLWFGMMYQAGIAKFDRKTEKLQLWSIPADLNKANTQINMTSPLTYGVDGKIWTQNNGFAGVHRVDLKTGKWETWEPFKESPRGHNIYDVIADSQNNAYFTDIGKEHIGRIDAKTGKVSFYETPTKNSGPRRGMMDAQDRIWFGQYRGNRIAMFDTRAEKFQEWPVPTPWSAPYDVAVDKNGEAWTGSMLSDRIARLDSKTGQFTEYLLPKPTNIRRVFVENSTSPVTFWVGSNHGASIIKLEPLD